MKDSKLRKAGASIAGVVTEGLSEAVTFEQRLEG